MTVGTQDAMPKPGSPKLVGKGARALVKRRRTSTGLPFTHDFSELLSSKNDTFIQEFTRKTDSEAEHVIMELPALISNLDNFKSSTFNMGKWREIEDCMRKNYCTEGVLKGGEDNTNPLLKGIEAEMCEAASEVGFFPSLIRLDNHF
jgi:hypothetical protein